MTEKMCIFHHPFPVAPEGKSGSQVRPYKMLEAFRAAGYEVEAVTGFAKERQRKVAKVLEQIDKGRTFSFVYAESQTTPTLLTEPHHLPTHPRLDFGFLQKLHKTVPIGLFYRDIHWRFEQYRHLAWHKRAIAVPFYYYDWYQYKRTVDHLFIPSQAMAQHLPSVWPAENLGALPPGSPLKNEVEKSRKVGQSLNLFYVGGVTPPLYNLEPLFDFTQNSPATQLTLCCRQEEWLANKPQYQVDDTTAIVHASGNELDKYYARADLFVMLWQPHAYLDFAMPVKTFEALAHGLPIITMSGTEVARFVLAEDVGWVVDSKEAFQGLIKRLQQQPDLLAHKRKRVLRVRENHTWEARARQVAQTLEGYKK